MAFSKFLQLDYMDKLILSRLFIKKKLQLSCMLIFFNKKMRIKIDFEESNIKIIKILKDLT